jgi:protein SCO1/2
MLRTILGLACAATLVAWMGLAQNAYAEDLPPKEFDGVGITEHLGDTLPLELTFKDSTGKTVQIGDYLDGDRPVILTLVYYNCPMLCNMILNGLIEGMADLEWTTASDFQVISVSIDAREGPELAAKKKISYLEQYAKPNAGQGWHFLTGERDNIKALAEAVGFGFKYDADRMEYAHGAAIFMVSPKGKLTRYLYGVQFPAKQLKLALTEAGEGKLGSAVDQFVLRCYHFDPDSRKYGIYVWGVMRAGGLLTILLVGLMLAVFWRRERRRGTVSADADPTA